MMRVNSLQSLETEAIAPCGWRVKGEGHSLLKKKKNMHSYRLFYVQYCVHPVSDLLWCALVFCSFMPLCIILSPRPGLYIWSQFEINYPNCLLLCETDQVKLWSSKCNRAVLWFHTQCFSTYWNLVARLANYIGTDLIYWFCKLSGFYQDNNPLRWWENLSVLICQHPKAQLSLQIIGLCVVCSI